MNHASFLLIFTPLLLGATPVSDNSARGSRTESDRTGDAKEMSSAQVWENANRLYEQGKYSQTIPLYETLLKNDEESPYIHYNLGNAYFKNGELGPAILHFHKAWEIRPRDQDIRFNLELALENAGETISPSGIPAPAYIAFHWLNLNELRTVFLTFYWIFFLLLAFRLLTGKNRFLQTPLLGFALIAALSGFWWGLRLHERRIAWGVVRTPSAEIRNGPTESATVGFTLPAGRQVWILSEKEDYWEIKTYKEGLTGWVQKDRIGS